jgi:serine/threonine protein kinase/tetratricopeptide (TPR) repeat protein
MVIKPLAPRPILINNRYELGEKLGEGGMGTVYSAIDRLYEERVALKQVKMTRSDPKNHAEKRILQNRMALTVEFQALASLHHPNIVGVLDYGWDSNNTPFFTMTYLEQTKNILVASQDATIDVKLDYLVQLLQALLYVHRRGMVHRDLKPDNILVTTDGRVKLVDFGIAATEDDEQNGMLGTMLYMPPEVIRGGVGKVNIKRTADLYAVGLIAYEMFTGVYPFDTNNSKSLLRDILNTIPDLSLIPDLTSERQKIKTRLPLQTIVGRLTGKDPNFRYQDVADVIEDLSKIVGRDAIAQNTEVRESFLQAASFIGREPERDLLLTHLNKLQTGESSTFLVGGESGVGKSRLIEEVRIQALVKGITVLRGKGISGGGLPFQLWRDIVRRLVLSTDITDSHASVLSEIVPDISELLNRDLPTNPTLQGDATRTRLIKAILALIAKQTKPIILLLEDLQWTTESLDILKQLNQHIDTLQIMIIGNFRDDETPHLPEELPTMQLLKLNRLSAEEISELSVSMLGVVGLQTELIELLQRETEGNVFFVIEVVRVLAKEAGQLSDIGNTALPNHIFAGGIQDIIQRRLDQVADPLSYEFLKLAAIYRRYIDLNVMQTFIEQSEMSLDFWLHDCANATVLELIDGEWRFAHDKLREHILNSLSDEEFVQLNSQMAEVVESLYGEDLYWDELLTRLWRDAGNIDKEFAYMQRWIDRLLKYDGDYDRVRDLSDYALSVLPGWDVRSVDFLNPLSQICWRSGQYEKANMYATHANTLAKHHNYTEGLAASYNNLGNTAYYLGHYQTAIIYYRQSADIYHELDNQWHWALNLQNIGWTYAYIGDYESAWDFTEEGQSIFIQLDEVWGVANGYYIMALITTHQENFEDALEFHLKSIDLFSQFGESWNDALNLTNLGFVYLALNRLEGAQRIFYECMQLCYKEKLNGSLLESLVGIAQLHVYHRKEKRAAILLGMVQAHPAINSDVKMRITPLQQILESTLSEADLQTALQQGATMDMNTTVSKMLGQEN